MRRSTAAAKKPNKSRSASRRQTSSRFEVYSSADFSRETHGHEWLIDSILVKDQVAVIGGPPKTMKTSLAIDMALSLASGTEFLNTFPVNQPRSVALFSGETSRADLQDTARRICESKELALEDCAMHWIFDLPRLSDPQDRDALNRLIREHGIEIVIFDPLYLCLFAGASAAAASNLYEVGPLLRSTAEACLTAGATPVFIHHSAKSRSRRSKQAASEAPSDCEPLQLSDLAFAGISEFARQWLLVCRRKEFVPGTGSHSLLLSAGGSSGHAGQWNVSIYEGGLPGELASRTWQVEVTDNIAPEDPDFG